MALTDLKPIGRGDRGADLGFGLRPRFRVLPFARPAAMAEDSEQPVPWVFLVAMRGAASAMRRQRVTR